jgi:hypothetical protein
MASLFLCIGIFLAAAFAARRSLGAGVAVVLAVGYAYGITRANLQQPLAHLIFDAGVLGLYAAQLWRATPRADRVALRPIQSWVILLCAWPVVLFCLSPERDPLVELVGLRSNLFLLPFILIGSRLTDEDAEGVARTIAVLNLCAAGLAGLEFVVGLEPFLPRSEVTDLIYRSNDLIGRTAYRIPSSFPNAHVFGGTMVMTIPWLAGALMRPGRRKWELVLFTCALAASLLGVFAAAARTPMVVLAAMVVMVTMLMTRFKGRMWVQWGAVIGLVVYFVSSDARLQRFVTLQDTAYIQQRVAGSINHDLLDLMTEYPLGKGLAGGGTSIPYFLQERQESQMTLENEYARIALELGMPGLLLWILFFAWIVTRSAGDHHDPWYLGRRVAWVGYVGYFVIAMTGIGLLSAVPQSSIMLMNIGWVAAAGPRARQAAILARRAAATRTVRLAS